MKVPLSWLKKYVEIDKTPEDIADILTMAGLEVDAIEEYLPGFSGVVVAEVLDTTSHPDADNLCIARVFDGSEEYSVVCGASNCRKGLRVAFAAIGAVLAGPDNKAFKIKKSKIRGVESMGMLCSEEELSLADSAEGIMELPKEFSVGENLGEELGDTIFDISLTPNLGHCLSIIGVAREVAALTGKSIKHPEYSFVEASEGAIVDDASVIVEDAGLCPRYCCRVIKGVKVGPSPLWLQNKLVHCGFKSINNIVDATNYVLMEYGHPLHAFDYHNLSGGAIIVKTANEGDKFVTLDGEECILHEGALMICDGKDPVAIAGVMGGENSAVSADTVDLLIESAYFCPKTVRKTSRLLGIATESSKRFERGIDPNNVPVALERVTALIVEVAGGDVVPGIIDAKESPFVEAVIPCRVSRINKLLGTKLAVSEIQTIFDSLQFSTTWDGVDTFDVAVPTYRNDITAEIDLVEEVARIYGYNNITTSSLSYMSSKLPDAPIFSFENIVRERLLGEGLQEFISCDLISPELASLSEGNGVAAESLVKILNPTSVEQSVLRASMMPGMLQLISHNVDHGTKDVTGFEIGRIHLKEEKGYREHSIAAIVMTGKTSPEHWGASSNDDADFYDIKGVVENVIANAGIEEVSFVASNFANFHPGRQAIITIGDVELGIVGEVHPTIQKAFGIPQRIMFSEINLHNLFSKRVALKKFREIPQFPGSERDWTVTLKEEASVADVIAAIRSTPSKLLENVGVIAVYRSETIGKGLKNVTFSFLYRDKKKTIAAKNVDRDHTRIIDNAVDVLKKNSII